jgi:hypothetical protein
MTLVHQTRPTVRAAGSADVAALVTLRLANAAAHLALDAATYRLPPRAAIERHFTGRHPPPQRRSGALLQPARLP